MEKQLLAQQLRERHYKAKRTIRKVINSLTDDEIIKDMVCCECCGEPLIDSDHLIEAIEKANSAAHFLIITQLMEALQTIELQN